VSVGLLERNTAVHARFAPLLKQVDPRELQLWLTAHRLFVWPEFDRSSSAGRLQMSTNTAHNLLLIKEFRRVVQTAGVPLVPIKGILLLDTLYRGALHLRQCRDIDLMIRHRDLPRALLRFRRGGYEIKHARLPAPVGSHCKVVRPGGPDVDLHVRYAFSAGSTARRLMPREGTCHGMRCLVPDADCHTLFLAWHLLKHVFNGKVRLLWADEVARLVQDRPGEVEARAARMGCHRRMEFVMNPFVSDGLVGGSASWLGQAYSTAFQFVDYLPPGNRRKARWNRRLAKRFLSAPPLIHLPQFEILGL